MQQSKKKKDISCTADVPFLFFLKKIEAFPCSRPLSQLAAFCKLDVSAPGFAYDALFVSIIFGFIYFINLMFDDCYFLVYFIF